MQRCSWAGCWTPGTEVQQGTGTLFSRKAESLDIIATLDLTVTPLYILTTSTTLENTISISTGSHFNPSLEYKHDRRNYSRLFPHDYLTDAEAPWSTNPTSIANS